VQLKLAALAGAAVLAAAAPALADVEAASHVMLFQEPSSHGRGVRVIHPQTEVSATSGGYGISAGSEMDIVSGATARTYGADNGPDAVSGATFSDTRYVARAGASFETRTVGVSAGYSYGWENDYRSHTVSVAARGDFLERNFTLALGYTRNFDSVCDHDNSRAQTPSLFQPLGTSTGCFKPGTPELTTHAVSVDTFEPQLTWTATPFTLIEAGGTLQIVDGFQSNPYRTVSIGTAGRTPQEHLPEHRQRYALFLRAHQGLPWIKGAVHVGGRAYRDTWDVMAATADLELVDYLGPSILVGIRGRFHKQSGAAFFRNGPQYRVVGPAGQYWTGDRELSPFENLLTGAKLTFVKRREQEVKAFIEELELGVRFDVLLYHQDVLNPASDRNLALITQVGLSLRF
jgi:hypothetical protein